MIVADIIGGLGNQLFIYAATKSIAEDLGYEYRYRVIMPGDIQGDHGFDRFGNEYCSKFEQAFNIDTSERIEDLPKAIQHKWMWRRLPKTNYNQEVYSIPDNSLLCGHFLSPKYFEHRRQEVLQWLRFRDDYIERCNTTRNRIVESVGANHLVGVHMRCGRAYQMLRWTLDPSYHRHAIQKMRCDFGEEKLCFVLFSDAPDEARRLLGLEDVVVSSGTVFEDLCSMTMCDSLVVANSTFSWWGAWLAHNRKGQVIIPSLYAPGGELYQPDFFPADWVAVDAVLEKVTPRVILQRFRDEYPTAMIQSGRRILKPFKRLVKHLLAGS
jgi:hypothetical protein